ncbi:MAG: ATP-binding protein, partial [Pseudomonadota bacterium]
EGRVVLANLPAQRMFGFDGNEMSVLTVEDLIPQRLRDAHPEERAEYGKSLASRMTGKGLDIYGLRRDGHEFNADISLSPLGNGFILSRVRDVTQRKQALIEAREFAESIVATIQEPLVVLDQDYRLVSANRAFYQFFRLTQEEAVGQLFYELHDRQWDIPELRHLLSEVLPKERTVEGFELAHEFPGIGNRTLLLNASRVVGRAEKRRLILIAMEDITERKRLESEQIRIIHELECANEELRNFAYVVSHDLKAPLRGIGALANWIVSDQRERLDAEGRKHLQLLIQRVHRMDALIDGVLRYSRAGRLREAVVSVDLDKLAHDVVDMLSPPANIAVEIKKGLPVVKTERTCIQQVFQNLLSNAIRFMDKSEGRIEIDCEEDGAMWKFSVTDNGPGIEARHFERIFHLFQTLHSRDRCESTGVGLAIVKKIVDMYGGRVWIDSTVGQGSTFSFSLPKSLPYT